MSNLDKNSNGQLDPDEQEGRISGFIERLQSVDPSIKPGQPIPLSKITEAFEKMRQGGSSGRGGDDRGGDDRSRSDRDRGDRGGDDRGDSDRGRSRDDTSTPTDVEPLVPGFGTDEPFLAMLGFGPSAEIMAVTPIEADFSQAREVIGRHDRNKDGQIDKEELSRAPFWGTPMDFDRNGDGKLSERELATRQAVRRGSEESRRDKKDDGKGKETTPGEPTLEDFEGRKSYRVYAASAPEGVPRFFTDRDLNTDGQISMSEYTSEWKDSLIAEFYGWDRNRDGVITASEVQSGVNQGLTASEAPRGVSPQSSMTSITNAAAAGDASSGDARSSSEESAKPKLQMPSEPPSEKMMAYAKKILSKYDKNGDLALSATEWSKMLLSPADADFDGDGRVTVLEYAGYLTAKSNKGK